MPAFTRRRLVTMLGGAVLAAPFVRRARAAGSLNVYNWADYIGETTVADFEKETGIAVTYDNFASVEEMEAKLLAGSSGYDVVLQSGRSVSKMIAAKIYQKFDKPKLSLWSNLDPAVLKICQGWDPGNDYSMPYMWGSVGLAFNVDMVKQRLPNADMQSLDILLKPDNASKLADCGISILDAPDDVLSMVLKYIGRDPDLATEADYRAAAEVLKPVRKYIKAFDNTNTLNALPNKELCVANSWAGDYATAQARAAEAGVKINLAYYVPKTGAPAWVDCWSIPSDAANKDNAYRFLNYLLEPEVIAKCSNFTHYANANSKALPFVDQKITSDPAVYPDKETMSRLYAPHSPTEEQERAYTRVWADVKSG
ncbi:MAG: polyamine ABC transporter substrate-binding protein [Mesorhizobium sp.]|nr:MAG: polyamine ABC transporter substrate-binding protein [Mesorhizobium sp.]RWG96580.1 MAG: polyamine ABC transporter substrate-binding protein [Mesorhizobium sp.]TIN48727.1 MAG: polyamine ABC transporter substrate-binding protein [Mesorhizobium sp.]TIR91634.1 MAG: polyamine ABC transporter substrate-binding protein [Mesorhizobium sp.]